MSNSAHQLFCLLQHLWLSWLVDLHAVYSEHVQVLDEHYDQPCLCQTHVDCAHNGCPAVAVKKEKAAGRTAGQELEDDLEDEDAGPR
jgi:hypothetical protein